MSSLAPGLARAQEGRVALGFSNLVARLVNDDEIGFARPEYRVYILEGLRSAGFNAVGAESLVFSRDDGNKADLILGGTVREFECRKLAHETNCRIGVAWEVFDRQADKVVYRVLTRYTQRAVDTRNHVATGKRLTLGALRSLMTRPHFVALAGGTKALLPQDEDFAPATFRECQAPIRELPASFDAAAEASVMLKDAQGFGSGFFLGSEGLILTAAHVVDGITPQVRLRSGAVVPAEVLRISREHDVALLRIATGSRDVGSGPYPCLALDIAPKQLGIDAYAIGAPASQDLAFSITRGIVSGLRTIRGVHLIQTDAAVSPGNSGGPLVDKQARVIAIMSRKLASQAVEGIGFGIPIEDALAALKLEPAAATSQSLVEPKPTMPSPISVATMDDRADAIPSLDPDGDARRAQLAAWRASVPSYIAPMRTGGWLALGAGGVGALWSWYTVKNSTDGVTYPAYTRARLVNDVSWTVLVLGSSAIIASYVLEPQRPVEGAGRPSLNVALGPGGLGLKGSFR